MQGYIKREAELQLKKWYGSGKILILLGARQVGKTTLLQNTFQNRRVLYLNLDTGIDIRRINDVFNLEPVEAVRSLGDPEIIVFDEAQKLPEVNRLVKGWYDKNVFTDVVLSGSSSLDLLDRYAESLTGRNVKLFLPPLLFSEILKNTTWYTPETINVYKSQIDALLSSVMIFGSYPESVKARDKQTYLGNLVSDYLLKDILQSGLLKTSKIIQNLLALLALQTGSLVSVNELANTLGVSRITVNRYLDYLEKAFVVFRLPALSTNPRKEISKSSKIYFWDTGVRNSLIGETDILHIGTDIGRLWENWVIAEFAKKVMLDGNINRLFFWRSKQGSEVDLILKNVRAGKMSAYEIKWGKGRASKSFVGRYNIPVEVINKENYLDFLFL